MYTDSDRLIRVTGLGAQIASIYWRDFQTHMRLRANFLTNHPLKSSTFYLCINRSSFFIPKTVDWPVWIPSSPSFFPLCAPFLHGPIILQLQRLTILLITSNLFSFFLFFWFLHIFSKNGSLVIGVSEEFCLQSFTNIWAKICMLCWWDFVNIGCVIARFHCDWFAWLVWIVCFALLILLDLFCMICSFRRGFFHITSISSTMNPLRHEYTVTRDTLSVD